MKNRDLCMWENCCTFAGIMIQLRDINTADPCYPFVERLWVESFPEVERRDTLAQRNNVDANPVFHCVLAENEGQPIGFLTYWDFDSFIYGEHFATDLALRNCGYGKQIFRAVLDHVARPFVLEVEIPDTEMSTRRIGFYERNGMIIWNDIPYTQPAYRVGGESLPMRLMATSDLQPEKDAADIIRAIHRYVYGV